MSPRQRAEMIEETRSKLIASARQAFGSLGYANTSMDDLTAEAGLTRGALYHHFGDKKGLLAAVVEQLDAEMDQRLEAISRGTDDLWEAFVQRCRTYLEMAQEAEIQRIVLQDARAVLGDLTEASEEQCVASLSTLLDELMQAGLVVNAPSEALARLINGSLLDASLWIARDEHPGQRLQQALVGLEALLQGLRVR
ncbi:Transcriptional regulator, AcrR family [Pseudomonas chlororaphis subsp. aurantiaca]|uniref:Transcriptional regulator, AcrR family n=1 Tax=Pseudomonas chlororaphis subsp. aureofaciens TaxID=587851 RepID=A0AAD0ZFG6_9PSED|nr:MULTISPECIES: TetR/AcrR family transcriptional regulator [Pseudomonas]AZD23424.1 Transcriptional regulator, AcrR family [Pseudomonas chlororaphis subsp. aurantiaca]AZD37105.1 Transcriptional regulator, AcrR family [Pseudomonas chlororaphis subsp. aurantiaca]AZD43444.1 Transcriptional regulator, AcrR family [Pseudomonas chlororaphis subsp. aurantiaca]AZD49686.1 Transcriptional regulator, AcrR family [Pseudomonas chlororaphis subsp. aurantiaca]AZD55990.1 Transcriptional regulator, AcrR family